MSPAKSIVIEDFCGSSVLGKSGSFWLMLEVELHEKKEKLKTRKKTETQERRKFIIQL